ncbi:CLUMA_CG003492, isoform A [Clunio marinus]|uniref:CLUMA_CG003492, isoform A n=1 Tax=Clunio marinus TaxID=568069 RepID=A0A1J1HTN4_9DIPT|nr:CLUMA_CG003492, isoform A [Clunio marinus]
MIALVSTKACAYRHNILERRIVKILKTDDLFCRIPEESRERRMNCSRGMHNQQFLFETFMDFVTF